MATIGLVLSYIEFLLPINIGIPGIKLGLANFIFLFALYKMDTKSAVIVNVLRIVLSGLLFSSAFGILYSLSGGILSMAVMIGFKKSSHLSIIGVSALGGIFHGIGQIGLACFIMSTTKILLYVPALTMSGIITGILIAIISLYLMENLQRLELN